jgi:hypothetical protein
VGAREEEVRPAGEKESGGEVGRCGLAGPEEGVGRRGGKKKREGGGLIGLAEREEG